MYIGAEEAEKLRRIISLLDPSQRAPRVSRHDLEGAALLEEIAPENPPMELRRAAEISRALSAPGSFAGAMPPRGFTGTLRDYQRTGYGWLCFLAENDLNGCLADDMGLGKTVQALALVQSLKEKGTAGAKGVPGTLAPSWRSSSSGNGRPSSLTRPRA
jgi:SNF2 family DNA or RNA helicase